MQPALAPAPHPGMQTSAQDHADQVLHDQLLAAQQHLTAHQHQQPPPRPHAPATQPTHVHPNTASPRDQTNIDPAIAGASMLGPSPEIPQPESPSDDGSKYGKRPLSTSKRAAQNRAAQRAFRQRKETYIRKLEDQVKHFENISDNCKALQAENYQLREHVINLQSRLLDSQGEVPELPANIDLSQPRSELPVQPSSAAAPAAPTNPSTAAGPHSTAPQQATVPPHPTPGGNDDLNSLNRIAVAGLGMRKHPNEETNYMANSFQAKRPRNEENQNEPSDPAKSEPSNGLPNA